MASYEEEEQAKLNGYFNRGSASDYSNDHDLYSAWLTGQRQAEQEEQERRRASDSSLGSHFPISENSSSQTSYLPPVPEVEPYSGPQKDRGFLGSIYAYSVAFVLFIGVIVLAPKCLDLGESIIHGFIGDLIGVALTTAASGIYMKILLPNEPDEAINGLNYGLFVSFMFILWRLVT
jgi:hypothetical protein